VAVKPTVPEDLDSLSEDRLQSLHERLGEYREGLRLEHRRVIDAMRAKEGAAPEQQPDEPTGGTVGTAAPQEG
jgi:hypothetical protein